MHTKWLVLVDLSVWRLPSGIHHHQSVAVRKRFLFLPSLDSFTIVLDNPCDFDCDVCDDKKGVCLRRTMRHICDPACDDDEICLDGECTWSNQKKNIETSCLFGQCRTTTMATTISTVSSSSCPIPCRTGQVCIEGRCGCAKILSDPSCSPGRLCYEICEMGEQCFNHSCSCGQHGKCRMDQICQFDQCQCAKPPCDQSNDLSLSSPRVFCPFPCLNGGRCVGFYRCQCRSDWTGHRCEQRRTATF